MGGLLPDQVTTYAEHYVGCTECARPKRSFPVSLQQAKGIRSIPDGDVNRYYLVWWPDPLWGIIELRPGAAWKFKFMLVIC